MNCNCINFGLPLRDSKFCWSYYYYYYYCVHLTAFFPGQLE